MYLHNIPKELVTPFFNLAYTIVMADNRIVDEEQTLLNLYAQELNMDSMPKGEVVDFDSVTKSFASLDATIRRMVFFELLSLAHADDDLCDKEIGYIKILKKNLDISDDVESSMLDVMKRLVDDYKKLSAIISM